MGLFDWFFNQYKRMGSQTFNRTLQHGASRTKNPAVHAAVNNMTRTSRSQGYARAQVKSRNTTSAQHLRRVQANPLRPAAQSPPGLIEGAFGWLDNANAQASKIITDRLPPQANPSNPMFNTAFSVFTGIPRATIQSNIDHSGIPAPKPVKETTKTMFTAPYDFITGFGRGAYEDIIQKPVTAGASYAAGAIMTGGLGLAARGGGAVLASQAVKNSPKINKVLTSVAAHDPTDKFVKGLGGLYALDVGARVALPDQDPLEMGRRAGGIAATEVLPMSVGAHTASRAAKSDLPLKVDSFLTQAKVRSKLPASDRSVADAVFGISRDINKVYSRRQLEPDLSKITNIGPDYAPGLKEFTAKQPHSIIGAGTRTGQIPESSWTRTTKDLDILVEDPMAYSRGALKHLGSDYALESVPPGGNAVAAIRTGKGKGSTAIDPHAFPEDYPIGKKTSTPIDDYNEPYIIKFMPKELLRGPDLTQEFLYTQVMRKSNAVIGRPEGEIWSFGPRQHRLKDALDLVTDTRYLAGELKAQSSPFRPITAAKNRVKAARLEKNTDTLVDYFSNPENVRGYLNADEYLSAFTKLKEGKTLTPIDLPEIEPSVNLLTIPKGSTYPFAADISPTTSRALNTALGISSPAVRGMSHLSSPILEVPSTVAEIPFRSRPPSPAIKSRSEKSTLPSPSPRSSDSPSILTPVSFSSIIPAPSDTSGLPSDSIDSDLVSLEIFSPSSPSPPSPSPPSPPIPGIPSIDVPSSPPPHDTPGPRPPPPPPLITDLYSPATKPPKSTERKSKSRKPKKKRTRDPYDWFTVNPVHDIASFFGTGAPPSKSRKTPGAFDVPDDLLAAPKGKKTGKKKSRDPLVALDKDFFEVKI